MRKTVDGRMDSNFGRIVVGDNITSFHRIGGSQDSRGPAVSQQTGSTSHNEESPLDGGRAQIRFQEFVARSRHLEILDILHDLKSRITNLEDFIFRTNNGIRDGLKELGKQGEANYDRTIAFISRSSVQQKVRSDQSQPLIQDCLKQLQTLSEICTTLRQEQHYMNNLAKAQQSELLPDIEDDMTLADYLVWKGKKKEKSFKTCHTNSSESGESHDHNINEQSPGNDIQAFTLMFQQNITDEIKSSSFDSKPNEVAHGDSDCETIDSKVTASIKLD